MSAVAAGLQLRRMEDKKEVAEPVWLAAPDAGIVVGLSLQGRRFFGLREQALSRLRVRCAAPRIHNHSIRWRLMRSPRFSARRHSPMIFATRTDRRTPCLRRSFTKSMQAGRGPGHCALA